MKADLDTPLVFALASKCSGLTRENATLTALVIGVAWLAMAIIYWAHPGGPAWGRYWLRSSKLSLLNCLFARRHQPIPGPRGLPLIGSMTLMSSPVAHRRIASAASDLRAERLMAFSMGDTRAVVTCHPDVAREVLNSPVFADRPVKESTYSLMFNRAMGFARYGAYWRTLRRIASNHLFSPKQIARAATKRRVIASQMVGVIGSGTTADPHEPAGAGFTVREILKTASLYNMMCSVFGKEYQLGSDDDREVNQLKELVEEGYDLLGSLNWTDHLPWLSEFDPQRIRLRCSQLAPKVNHFLGRIIADHRDQIHIPPRDFVDVLLSLQASEKLSDADIIAVLWEMIFRGTDTVAILIEWILARMVLHPDLQSRVQEELDRVVGRSKAVDESDIASLPYLTAVVKEVLRLQPPGPLLSWARLAITDTTVDGCHVPAGTTAMVNMWAISRDPRVWENPLEFVPDRFVAGGGEAEFSVLGSDLRLAPFGSGRRSCPGKNLGLTTVNFWVATLLHEFQWLPSPRDPVDLSEVLKLSCEMAHPLKVNVRPRRTFPHA